MRPLAISLLAFASALPLAALDPARPLSSYQRQTWQSENGLPQNTIHAILQTRDGYLWLATEGGLVRFDGVEFTVYDSQNTPALRANTIRALLEDRNGSLWIGTADGLTAFHTGQAAALFTRDRGLPNNSIFSLLLDPSGNLVAVTAGGAARFSDGRFVASPTPAPTAAAVALKDREGALWTANRALARQTNGKTESLPSGDPLASETILSLFEDREGNLWIGTESNGLTVLRDQKIATYTDSLTRCVYQDRQGTIWVGSADGLLKLGADGVSSLLTVANGLSSNLIFALGETPEGDLLVGTQDGLDIVHSGHITVLTTADGLPDDLVRSLYTAPDGAVWIGTRRGLTVWKNSRFHTFTEADGLASDLVGAITRSRDGALWIATLRGLTRYQNGRFQSFTTHDGLASNVVTALIEDSSGALWIGTADGGLHSMRNGKIFHYPQPLGLPASIFAIVEDGPFLWLASKSGLYRAPKAELEAASSGARAVSIAEYGASDGMKVKECSEGGHPAAWLARDGALWVATLRGVSTMTARAALSEAPPPPVVVESFSVDDRAIDLAAAKREIPPAHDRLAFEYTGITFTAPQRVRFRYRLEGFDRDWVDAETRRTAYYTSLAPGDYRFRVQARANNGDWTGQESSVSFRLLPRFYQTYWFYFLLLGAAALLAYAFYRSRVRRVEAQFAAVLAERNRIAREIHDTLAQGFVAVSLQLEILGRKLTAAPDDIKNLVRQIGDLSRHSLEDARRSIWELRSQDSAAADFRSRLSTLANETGKRAGLAVEFNVLGAYRALPEQTENELFKIAQEALANVVRHAHAKRLKVDLAYEPKKVRLLIADDGIGFDGAAAAPDGHFGLRGMRERAAQIGASLTVKSQPGQGAEVEVEKIMP